jgi:hypothetical protein
MFQKVGVDAVEKNPAYPAHMELLYQLSFPG